MKTNRFVLVVVALGVATMMWGMSGIGTEYGATDPITGLESGEKLEQAAEDSPVHENGSFNGSAKGGSEDNIVGLIISGTQALVSFTVMVGLLPAELMNLGFPKWFAMPVGLATQAIVGIGIVQFATNRVFH